MGGDVPKDKLDVSGDDAGGEVLVGSDDGLEATAELAVFALVDGEL